jgi:hypothetical protein
LGYARSGVIPHILSGVALGWVSPVRSMLCDKLKKTVHQPKPQQTPNFKELVGPLESALAKVYQNKGLYYL